MISSSIDVIIQTEKPVSFQIDSLALYVRGTRGSNTKAPVAKTEYILIPIAVGASSGFFFMLVVLTILLAWRIKKKRKEKDEFDYSEMELTASLLLKDVQILEVIGSGNFGVVYKGAAFGGIDIALKSANGDESEIINESKMLTKVQHVSLSVFPLILQPNCVRCFGVFKKDKELFIVTEFCSKGSLLDIIKQRRFSNEELLLK